MKAFLHRLQHFGGSSSKEKEKEREKDKEKIQVPPLRTWPPTQPERTSSQNSFKPLPPIETDNTPEDEPDNKPPSEKKVAFVSPPPTPAPVQTITTEPQPATSPPPPAKTNVTRFQAAHGATKEPRASVSTAASSSKTDVATAVASTSQVSTTPKPVATAPNRAVSPYMDRGAPGAMSAMSLRSGTPYSQMSQQSGSRILAATSWSEVTEDDLVSNLGSRERTRQEVLFEIIASEERYVQELIKMKDTFIDPLLHPLSTAVISTSPSPATPHPRDRDEYDYYRTESPSVEPATSHTPGDLPPIAARFMSPTPPAVTSAPPSRTGHAPIGDESPDTEDDEDRAHTIKSGKQPANKLDHPRSPYRSGSAAATAPAKNGKTLPFPSRSHMSLPPPPRNQANASTQSLGRQNTITEHQRGDVPIHRGDYRERKISQGEYSQKAPSGVFRKFKKSLPSSTPASGVFGEYLAPHQIPEDLKRCLEVVDQGIVDGHKRLSDALRKRYDDQFPLVRSLADVFVSNSDIFHGYATFVLHLERALDQVDAALHNNTMKKPKKQDAAEWHKVCRFLQALEASAADKGETGLAITLSKPFQRLLKYPLMFQNLLFHTDPSTYEYEATLQMVAEVESIVRSIEDEKIQKEERDRTRDVFARIEGLDKVQQLVLPKPSRVLVEERVCVGDPSTGNGSGGNTPPSAGGAAAGMLNGSGKGVKGKTSFKRLSDVLGGSGGIGGKKDLWHVVFNDVVLQCQRTGQTTLPLVSTTNSRTNSLPTGGVGMKYATSGRRAAHTKPRNLYKFIKIEAWVMDGGSRNGEVAGREGVVSMEDVVRTRSQRESVRPRIVPMPNEEDEDRARLSRTNNGPEDDGNDSDDSDKKSKMSFSYWGADRVTIPSAVVKSRVAPNSRMRGSGLNASYGRESSANAKFGSRLISPEPGSGGMRPASRRTTAITPSTRRGAEDGPYSAKATVTRERPAWGAGAGSPTPYGAPSMRQQRSRNSSQTKQVGATVTKPSTSGGGGPNLSPAPSEDSGVGLYRQMLANDPGLRSGG